jgi:hypothetical protein
MIDLVTMNTAAGLVLWARLWGQWAGANFDRLAARIAALGLPSGSQVVLDFSAIDHLDFRAVPHLVRLGTCVEARQAALRVVGLSEYLVRIVDFGGALDGREFLERHRDGGALGPARPAASPDAFSGGSPAGSPAAGGSASVARWAHSLAAASAGSPRARAPLGPRVARSSRRAGPVLRRAPLAAFAGLVAPSRN